jgi:hypothetical protein
MTSGPRVETTVRVSVVVAASCVGEVESDTLTVKVKLPTAVGVPDNTPAVEDSAIPFGRAPLTTDHT